MLAFLTPLPPVKSGIANYASMLLPALAAAIDLVVVVDQPEWQPMFDIEVITADAYRVRRNEFDRVVYQLGNNPHHEWIYDEAMLRPGVVVLHEVVLHHLLVERTLARGLGAQYVEEMAAMHGEAGRAWAVARVSGLHHELANFLFPAMGRVASTALSLIVHNRYALDVLRRHGIETPVTLVEHPLEIPHADAGDATRRELGFAPADRVVGMFGFVTEAKRPDVVIRAFADARREDESLRLLIVGEPAPNVDLQGLTAAAGLPVEVWQATGFVADAAFDGYLAAVDSVVNLRYPTAGETSGALLRAFAAGKPVAVNQYAQFAELPPELVTMIPFGDGEVASLSRFIREARASDDLALRQRRFLEEHASVQGAVAGYLKAIAPPTPAAVATAAPLPLIPLFPALSLERWSADGAEVRMVVRNDGESLLRAGVYGEPGYRIAVAVGEENGAVTDRWLPLGRDLAPGSSGELRFLRGTAGGPLSVELRHAMEGIPSLSGAPFARFEVDA